MRISARPLPSPLAAAALALLLVAAGCEPGLEMPTHARVVASVPAGESGGMVRLITSSVFSAEPGAPESIELVFSDTALVAVPFEREFEMMYDRGRRKLYVEVAPIDAAERPVRMQVLIAGERWYDVTVEMPANRHRFVYTER